jgi:hypothetical protein
MITSILDTAEQQIKNEPWWARFIERYGIATLLAAWLIYFITTGLSKDVKAMREEHQELRIYLRQICMNTAATDIAYAGCIPASASHKD